ncbi:MAG: hypothetical protein HN348_33805, partial [Proteobacteria bacterium]|nr:hypothetical protein [Pseudomonadota bacterium]
MTPLFLALIGATAHGSTVCPSACNYTTIGDAVANATSGETIEVAAGTYVESQSRFVNTDNITIEGDGSGTTQVSLPVATPWLVINVGKHITISGLELNQDLAQPSRALYFAAGSAGSLSDIKADGFAHSSSGSVIYVGAGAEVTVEDSSFSNNSNDNSGGVIHCAAGSKLNVSATDFNDNEADIEGGAISVENGSVLTLSNNYFNQNGAPAGGAIYLEASSIELNGDRFENNTASEGGAIFADGLHALSFLGVYGDAEFSSNEATNRGGAIFGSNSAMDLSGGEFSENTALIGTGSGGAIAAYNTNVITNYVEFSLNEAANGGAIHLDGGYSYIAYGELNENTASTAGGAVFLTTGSLTFTDNTATLNDAQIGGAVYWTDA